MIEPVGSVAFDCDFLFWNLLKASDSDGCRASGRAGLRHVQVAAGAAAPGAEEGGGVGDGPTEHA